MRKSSRKLAVGAIVAGAAGYVAGILTAPKSGKETRKDIHDGAAKVITESEHKLKELHSELTALIKKAETQVGKLQGKAKDELHAKAQSAGKAKEKARELLSALHDGDADSEDLKKAVTEIKSARDHLKKFFKD